MIILVAYAITSGLCAAPSAGAKTAYEFTEADKRFLSRFALSKLPALPPALSNRVADRIDAAKLGRALFYDVRLSASGKIACSTCHQPQRYFTDGRPRAQGLGITRRSAPSIIGAAYSPWQFWDGRRDSLWSQALEPIEHVDEQGISRVEVAQMIASHYRSDYEAVFEASIDADAIRALPTPASPVGNEVAQANWARIPAKAQGVVNGIFANTGKAIMAYERRLTLTPSRFDRFLAALEAPDATPERLSALFSEDEVKGMRLFMGRGNCASCHNGPLLTNHEFHNVGAPEPNPEAVDLGRHAAIPLLLRDEFTCLSEFSDAENEACEELRFLKKQGPELVGAYKTPTLRNVAMTAPYMQSGQLRTLEDVVTHYNRPRPPFFDPKQHPSRPHFDVLPLQLSEDEQRQLVMFLKTLTSPIPTNDPWWPNEPQRAVAADPE